MKPTNLPIGTYVRVAEVPTYIDYTGRIVGYDLSGSKYNIGREYAPGKFGTGGWWAFPRQVEVINEGKVTPDPPGEMVERVAQAIRERLNDLGTEGWDEEDRTDGSLWLDGLDAVAEDLAKVAIAAMSTEIEVEAT